MSNEEQSNNEQRPTGWFAGLCARVGIGRRTPPTSSVEPPAVEPAPAPEAPVKEASVPREMTPFEKMKIQRECGGRVRASDAPPSMFHAATIERTNNQIS